MVEQLKSKSTQPSYPTRWTTLYTLYIEGAEEQVAVEEEEEDECEFEPHEQLHMLTQYLRMWYLYCLWCGTKVAIQ